MTCKSASAFLIPDNRDLVSLVHRCAPFVRSHVRATFLKFSVQGRLRMINGNYKRLGKFLEGTSPGCPVSFLCKCAHTHIYTRINIHFLSRPVFVYDFPFARSSISGRRIALISLYFWAPSRFYVKKSIDSNSNEATRTDWPAWTEVEPELNQLDPEPTRAFSWRLDGCSDAIKSSRESSGHGSSSGFNSNRCFMQHFLPSRLLCK